MIDEFVKLNKETNNYLRKIFNSNNAPKQKCWF